METQEQILKEQRLRIEVLRHQLLLRYYELLLSLDVLTQAAEVKTLMGYINTLERYAKRFENKPSKKESGKKGRKNTADETTADDIHPEASISLSEHAKELFDMMALDDNLPSEENELPADIDDFLKAGYAVFSNSKNYEPIKIRHISKTTRPDKFKTASKKNPYPKIYTILPGSTKNLNMAS